MSFNSVFRFLQELFPQVDVRVLKAVAMEHSKDVDAAAEFILLEVLPKVHASREAKHTIADDQGPKNPEAIDLKEQSFLLKQADPPVEAADVDPSPEARPAMYKDAAVVNKKNDTSSSMSTVLSQVPIDCSASSAHGGREDNQVCLAAENEELVLSEKNQEVKHIVGSDHISHASPSISEDTVSIDCHSNTEHANIQEPHDPAANCFPPASGTDFGCHLYSDSNLSREEILPTDVQDVQSSFCEEKAEAVDQGSVVYTSLSECEPLGSRSSLENDAEQATLETNLVVVDDESFPTPIATRSGQTISIGFLQGFIEDAKNNKKLLSSAMESVISMAGDVELLEEEAEQSKKEADEAGQDILMKVDDLKQMLQHAKEANNMSSGEIYGERAILATEARELQSRLLNLSEARDKSLLIIDEIRQDLGARLAIARAEKVTAEQEKLEKEESARKALTEQELVMDKVVRESEKLQQEAEENAKLREFLIDRGHIVDILQGEIAVICEDVASLKQKIELRIPSTKLLSSSQMTSILSSSSTSIKSTSASQALERIKSSESLKSSTSLKSISPDSALDSTQSSASLESTGPEVFLNNERSEGAEFNREEKAIGDGRKTSSEDEWDLFDTEFE